MIELVFSEDYSVGIPYALFSWYSLCLSIPLLKLTASLESYQPKELDCTLIYLLNRFPSYL
jgi:hypothetical protein